MGRYKWKEEHLAYLKKCIIAKYTQTISNIKGAEAFRKANRIITSADTILRLFNKTDWSFSETSLSELTQYACGIDWHDFTDKYLAECDQRLRFIPMACLEGHIGFEDLKEKVTTLEKRAIVFQIFKEVILIKFAHKDIEFFNRIFEFENIFDDENYNYDTYYIIQLLGLLVLKNEWLQTIAIEYYHSLNYNRDYFVEWFIQPNEVYYNQLLDNYYKGSKCDRKKEIFYHLIKATQLIDASVHCKELNKVESTFWENHHILAMRWFGVQWIKEVDNRETIFKDLEKYLETKKDHGDYITCILFVTQYLYRAGSFTEVLELINTIEQDKIVLGHAGYLNWNNLKVYYVACLLEKGDKVNAAIIFKDIEPDQFDWNFRKELIKLYEEVKGKF